MKKKLLPIIMILVLLIAIPVQAFAKMPEVDMQLRYLNIGDSIAYGLSAAPGLSYFERYAKYLEDNYGLDENWPYPEAGGAVNAGVEGLDSMELLEALQENTQLKGLVMQADVITISIGGNNLLTPVIGAVAELYEVDPSSYPSSGAFIQALLGEIGAEGEMAWNMRLAAFTASALSSDPGTLGYALEARTEQFLSDWPAILDEIEELNPDAHIIAMTLYNPIEEEDNLDLYHRYEELVRPMNKAIMKTQNRAMVAKVEKSFAKEPDAVAFKLTWTDGYPPVLIDPHPTTMGHGIIFEELMKGRSPRSFQ
ncbi:GDSL-type esterase/lipase family protein [Gudongella sp. DL1XJH-153]|uniref:GDSL-type esterase/lipase family protein n=1 Tax=Gudongella sp. DL1XJH-153 TaxID=3409804 RepID=UPI003BB551B5